MKKQPSIVTPSQLDTYVHYLTEIHNVQYRDSVHGVQPVLSSDIKTPLGRPAQHYIFLWLEKNGYIEVRRGKSQTSINRVNTYSLVRPLSEISLVSMVEHLGMPGNSPTVKLLSHNRQITLMDLKELSWPSEQFATPGTFYAFDFILRVLSTLCVDTQISYRQIQASLGEHAYSYTYIIGALGTLAENALVARQARGKGYCLYRSFRELTIEEVIPAVSHRTDLFNKVLYLSKSLSLSLFV